MEGGALWGLFVQTFKSTIKSKWLLMFTLVFFFFAFNLPFLVIQIMGLLPKNYISSYIGTLISTTFTLMPLLALPLGAVSIVEERETGSLAFVLSTPTSRWKYLLARGAGLFAASSGIIILGFGLAALVGFLSAGYTPGTVALVYVTEAALFLNATMIGISMVISTFTRKRLTAHSLAILIWFLFTYAGATAGAGSAISTGSTYTPLIPWILLNPVEMGRLVAVFQIPSGVADIGITGEAIQYVFGGNALLALLGIMAVWVGIAMAASFIIFNYQDVA